MTVAQRIADTTHKSDTGKLPLLLKEKEAAELLGVPLSYLRKSRSEGNQKTRKRKTPAPPFVKVNDSVYYRRVDIDAWVDKLTPQQVIGSGVVDKNEG